MIAWLKALNPKRLVLTILKPLAIREIQKEGDLLQARLKLAVEEKGAEAIDRLVDQAQVRILSGIAHSLPAWAWLDPVKAQISSAVTEYGDSLQRRLAQQVATFGPSAIDKVCDEAQVYLIDKIRAL